MVSRAVWWTKCLSFKHHSRCGTSFIKGPCETLFIVHHPPVATLFVNEDFKVGSDPLYSSNFAIKLITESLTLCNDESFVIIFNFSGIYGNDARFIVGP